MRDFLPSINNPGYNQPKAFSKLAENAVAHPYQGSLQEVLNLTPADLQNDIFINDKGDLA